MRWLLELLGFVPTKRERILALMAIAGRPLTAVEITRVLDFASATLYAELFSMRKEGLINSYVVPGDGEELDQIYWYAI